MYAHVCVHLHVNFMLCLHKLRSSHKPCCWYIGILYYTLWLVKVERERSCCLFGLAVQAVGYQHFRFQLRAQLEALGNRKKKVQRKEYVPKISHFFEREKSKRIVHTSWLNVSREK